MSKYGRLTIINKVSLVHPRKSDCICECGSTKAIWVHDILAGKTQSCGCLHKELVTTHGLSNSPTYRSYHSMIQRCTNSKATGYENYGGRGISVYEEWLISFESFLEVMGVRPENTTLDREDNEGDYEPSNCRWSTVRDQLINRRKKEGCSSKYLGVSWHKGNNYWISQTRDLDGERIYIGSFTTEEEAAIAYDDYISVNNLPNAINFEDY